MDAQSIDNLRDALTQALLTYRQLRPQLFATLIELQQTLGGPWKISWKRDPAEGDSSIPPKIRTESTTKCEMKLDNRPDLKFLNLAAIVNVPETFAPFHDFTISKDEKAVAPESTAAGIGMRIRVILETMLKAAKTFAASAHKVREAARAGIITTDARPILALDERFPSFPYWPIFPPDKKIFDSELAKEVPLLDAAELAIALLAGKIFGPPSSHSAIVQPAHNPFESVEPHCHLPVDAKAALWAACEMVLADPGDFTDAVTWLESRYSEAAVLDRALKDSVRKSRVLLVDQKYRVDRCAMYPRSMALRAANPEIKKSRRLWLLVKFYSVRELSHISPEFIVDLSEHPEKVRDWMVQLTIGAALGRGWRIEGDKVVTRNAANEGNLVSADNVDMVWRWLDEQSRECIRHIKAERLERETDRRIQAKDRGGRLRQAVRDVVDAGLPAGRNERLNALRVVLLACLLSYQHELKLPGEFCGWQWNSEGSIYAVLVGGVYVPGRESALFNPTHRHSKPFDAGSLNLAGFDGFVGLVDRAVRILRHSNQAISSATAMTALPEQSELEIIRAFIGALDAYAANDAGHRQFSQRYCPSLPGMAGVLRDIEPSSFFAANKHFHQQGDALWNAVTKLLPELKNLAARYAVGGGVFGLLAPHKPADIAHARATAVQLADAVCGEAQRQKTTPELSASANAPSSTQPLPTTDKGDYRQQWLAKAMLMVRDHPDWSDAEIARHVGKHPGTLTRSKEYQLAADLARGSKTDLPQGHVTVDSDSGLRDVEAEAPAVSPSDDKADRGQTIAGSKYVREYCAECEEPIKVPPDKVGTKPLCDRCET